ncbi:MAG TPA: carboxypeptidase-like regulatory domain-containing protein [Gemmataceae bacterium]|nr:carboxypeptidase-like regulatory domain-containing protein [Gemmataceae bacterium]
MRLLTGAAALTVLLACGCSGSRGDRPEAYPVAGRLLIDGEPAAGARVQLSAVGNERLAALSPHAVAEADGSFRLTTYRTGDGAPAGRYALTVTWPGRPQRGHEEGPDRLHGRYANPLRPARTVEIAAAKNDLGTIQLP